MPLKVLLAVMLDLAQFAVGPSSFHVDDALQVYMNSDFAAEAELARKGDPEAQGYLSAMYRDGRGAMKNPSLALAWENKSAKAGWAKAQTGLAFRYRDGDGVRQSDRIAARWFERAAAQKEYVATIQIADMYREGKGVARDVRRALHWYASVADEEGAVLARQRFAEICVNDFCTSADRAAAYKYLTMDLPLRLSGSEEVHRTDLLRKLALGMTPEQIESSQRLAYAWQAKHPLPLPAL